MRHGVIVHTVLFQRVLQHPSIHLLNGTRSHRDLKADIAGTVAAVVTAPANVDTAALTDVGVVETVRVMEHF